MAIEVEDQDVEVFRKRYVAALHAVQSGVALAITQGSSEATPKHLRVGVNSAMIDASAIARLPMQKGVFTEREYFEMLAIVAEEEQASYEGLLGVKLG